jgi:hypothetical protein
MVPEAYREFFGPVVGASAALVGLLFIAISVAPDRVTGRDSAIIEQSQATSALTAFLNPLIISLVAMLPSAELGIPATVVGVAGLLFVAATLRRYFSVTRAHRGSAWGLVGLIAFTAVSGVTLAYGIVLLINPHDTDAVATLAAVTIVSLLIGVDRAWALIGGRGRGRLTQLRDLVRGDGDDTSDNE